MPGVGIMRRGARNLSTTLQPYFEGSVAAVGRRSTPKGFGRAQLGHEQKELASRLAMSTFVEMCNAGHSFEAAITAVYMTGFENAFAAGRDKD